MEDLLNHTKILNKTKNKKDLSVTLKNSKDKGVGLYATKKINKGDIIAYYKVKIFRKTIYESPSDYVYSFEVYKKNGDEYKRFIGDIDVDSFPEPKDNISYWAPFANEPSKNQKSNATIEIDLKENYKNKNYSVPGETMTYLLMANRKINPKDEIL